MSFTHLHVHSHYSLLNALPKPKELVAAAKKDGQTALALTDLGALYGAVEFYMAAEQAGIKPIIGVEVFIAPRTMQDRDGKLDKPYARAVLLAKNNNGYENLIKLVTDSYCEGFYYKPRVDHERLERYAADLVCIIPSFAGEPVIALKEHNPEKASRLTEFYHRIFGDDLYFEITHHPEITNHQELQEAIVAHAQAHTIPLVAAHDVYYLTPEDHTAREALLKIGHGGILDTFDDGDGEHEDFSFITQAQANEFFAAYPGALANTQKIAEQCTVQLVLGQDAWKFPNFIIESGKEPDDELAERAYEGYVWRGYTEDNTKAKERLEYELGVIRKKGYAKYFLVVGDLLRESRERGILTTIRGSVAGSFCTYVLGITNVDPLEYYLPFERFLNPERPSAPDIDMDYADDRRDEIIAYARDKYGADKVAQIGTFGTMLARAAVRDIARVLGHPYSVGDQIAKLIPMGSQGAKMTIAKALDIDPDLAELYAKNTVARDVIDLAKKIEGRVRQLGVHAAGVVIAPEPLNKFVPVQPDPKTGKLITQYEMRTVGEDGVGLLKFDFLGLRNLAILSDAVKRVRKIREVDIDIESIPIDDAKTFAMLARGETMGLFQLNGSGMTAFLKQLRPSTIHDINAMVALYRPGPMESIPQYIERKHNPTLVRYLDPRLETILNRSYGIITYQDDVMMIAIELAGYSWLDADKLRKAMGKKVPEVMEAEKGKLLKGFVAHGGLSDAQAQELWSLIEPFAAYGFNKAHAASYGRVAYQTAYMKANYPVIYMSAVLTAESGDTEEIAAIIRECERMGIEVLPPDINESHEGFSVAVGKDGAPDKIRFGLTTIKNFGAGIAESIIAERKKGGVFASLEDFLSRVTDKNLNKKSLESLIMVGAFDSFGESRGTLIANIDLLLLWNKDRREQEASAQDSLFGGLSSDGFALVLAPAPDVSSLQKLIWEKDLLGIYVSGHPLDSYAAQLAERPSIRSILDAATSGNEFELTKLKRETITAGMIDTIRPLLTQKGDRMAFIRLTTAHDNIEMVAFPEVYKTYAELLTEGSCVAVKGKLSMRKDEPSILIDAVRVL